jgi:hypothetical protein
MTNVVDLLSFDIDQNRSEPNDRTEGWRADAGDGVRVAWR